jgi:hypothetical protein
MKKNRWAAICKLLKWGVPSSMFLLFSFISIGSSITTTHGMSSSGFPTQFSNPFDMLTPTPIISPTTTSTPTTSPITSPTPTPTMVQTSAATATPHLQLRPSGAMFPVQTMVTVTPTIITPTTPTSTPASLATVTTVPSKTIARQTTLTDQQLPNTGQGDKVFSTFVLPLSVGVPLLLVSAGMFWLIRRRQMNQYKPALLGVLDDTQPALLGVLDDTQPALWASSHDLDSDFNAFHYATGASGSLPVPVMSQKPYIPTQTSPLSFTQSAYTLSGGLPSLPTSFRQPMPTISSNQPARSLQDENWLPFSLNLPAQPIEARESNKYEQVLPPATAPMISLDTPISSIPSPSQVLPVVSRPIRPPSTKDDPWLGEVMRQAQIGLFVVLGRE